MIRHPEVIAPLYFGCGIVFAITCAVIDRKHHARFPVLVRVGLFIATALLWPLWGGASIVSARES